MYKDIAAMVKFAEGIILDLQIAIEIYIVDKPKLLQKYLTALKRESLKARDYLLVGS